MKKERINKKGKESVDYLRDRPYVGEFAKILQGKLPRGQVIELLDFLKTTNFAVVKKIPVVLTRTY